MRTKLFGMIVITILFTGCFSKIIDFERASKVNKGDEIDKKKWNELRIGMSKKNIEDLLGYPLRGSIMGGFFSDENSLRFYEYEYQGPLLRPFPLKQSYVVFFSRIKEEVVAFRMPLTEKYIEKVDEDHWLKIKEGMKKEEVKIIMGRPLKVTKIPDSKHNNGYEFWEYELCNDNFDPEKPNEYSYVIYFSRDGKVKSLRKPLVEN